MSTLGRNVARSPERGAAILWLIVLVLLVVAGGTMVWRGRAGEMEIDPSTLYTVKPEDLRVSVLESGQLKAARSTDIQSAIRGNATILRIVDEGKWVNEGEFLVELDVSGLEDDLTAQRIKYTQAEASRTQAELALAIQQSENKSKIARAMLDLELAEKELEKWNGDGKKVEQDKVAIDLALAKEEEERAKQKLEETIQLFERNFAAEADKKNDQLAANRASNKVKQLEMESKLKSKYDWNIEERKLDADVTEKKEELKRVEDTAKADETQKRADLSSREDTVNLEKEKLDRITNQLDQAVINAPTSGLVVYPSNSSGRRMGSDRDRIERGAPVQEHQLIISLPDTSMMVAALQVHESQIDKVKVGQNAIVTMDARSDEVYYGKVSFKAPLPDSTNSWLNPDLKVYRVEVTLAGDTTSLRPGMSVATEIVIDDLKGTLSVPVHAVHREGPNTFCYVDGKDGAVEIRPVSVGLNNYTRVAIADGLAEGDKVYLAVPPNAPKPNFPKAEGEEGNGEMSLEDLEAKTQGIATAPAPQDGGARPNRGFGGPGGMQFDPAAMEKFQNMTDEEKAKAREEMMKRFQSGEVGGRGPRGDGSGGENGSGRGSRGGDGSGGFGGGNGGGPPGGGADGGGRGSRGGRSGRSSEGGGTP